MPALLPSPSPGLSGLHQDRLVISPLHPPPGRVSWFSLVCLTTCQALPGTSPVAPEECPLGAPAAHYGKEHWAYLQSGLQGEQRERSYF